DSTPGGAPDRLWFADVVGRDVRRQVDLPGAAEAGSFGGWDGDHGVELQAPEEVVVESDPRLGGPVDRRRDCEPQPLELSAQVMAHPPAAGVRGQVPRVDPPRLPFPPSPGRPEPAPGTDPLTRRPPPEVS